MQFLKNNWFKVISTFVFIMVGFSMFYYFLLRPYQNDKPYRECVKQIDPNANFKDVWHHYANCVDRFK